MNKKNMESMEGQETIINSLPSDKKNWQAPALKTIDYRQTAAGGGALKDTEGPSPS